MEKYLPEDLIAFETDIANCFNEGIIKAPVHLYDGNEEQIIKVFQDVSEDDWVFCTWRSHYQCLLKGVPKEQVKTDILNGKSITLCYPEHKVYSSALVTGSIPIATGVALDIKRGVLLEICLLKLVYFLKIGNTQLITTYQLLT